MMNSYTNTKPFRSFIIVFSLLLVDDGYLQEVEENLEPSQLLWMSLNSNFEIEVEITESIQAGIKAMEFIGDQILVGLEYSVVPELLPLLLSYNDVHHDGELVTHKSKEGGEQYLQQIHSDTTVFIEPAFDNADVAETLKEHVDLEMVKPISEELLSKFNTRYAYSPTGRKAAKWILQQFEEIAAPRDDITVEGITEPDSNQISVVVSIQGTSSTDNVVLGSHLDSTSQNDGPMTKKKDAPGMDDNASGVLVLMEILRVIVETGYQPETNVQLMAVAAEELGLLGSQQIAADYAAKGKNVLGMLQFDGCGYQGPIDFLFTKDFSNNDHAEFLAHLTKVYLPGKTYMFFTCGYECSDYASWYINGYPSGYAMESAQNPNYHTQNDKFIDFDYMGNFVRLGLVYLAELAKGAVA